MSEQPSLLTHQNQRLFADYFLNERVPQMDGWQAALSDAAEVQKALRTLRQDITPENLDEAQLEQLWIRPVFEHLGLSYALQVKFRRGNTGYVKPDYVFSRNPEDAAAIGSDIYTPDQLRHTLAVADAKKWGINLDKTSKNERNPAQQIDEYLRYSERPWGVLTDGRVWRLYHRDSSKNNVYYAVDLDALLAADAYAFNYFYAFFRREAFTSGFLQQVLSQSQDFAQKVTDDLEQQVHDALTEIAQGFLDYRPNTLSPTPETLAEIYQASLVLLYRLLFIFYAESRQILPLEHESYRVHQSIDALKKDIAKKLEQASANYPPFSPNGSSIYCRLQDLFFTIDQGETLYGILAYNGKLFSEVEYPFLKKYRVGDAYLAPALDKLARVTINITKTTFERAFVDYRDLDVRHLGSIYEKLLDYELDVAETNLTESKKGQFVPAAANDEIIVPAGKLFLRTGSFERKTTGSYYTPDYIVRFIVEKTLEPLLTSITEKYATKVEGSTWQVGNAPALVHDVLSLNILDPATGSGHFAVDAASYIAEWLTALALTPQDAQLDAGDATIGEDELVIWKRLVASACIYAVDSNPLAVELAKLSLWLTTLARGKPLSFLDHHIRVGNSLVGAKVSALTSDLSALENRQKRQAAIAEAAAKGQVSMFADDDLADGVRSAASMMRDIETTIASNVADVKKQEQLYAQLTERLSHWQQAADVWTAKVYGLPVSESDWRGVWQQATTGKTVPEAAEIITQAQQLANEQHFFHWELAFPEVFFDTDGKPKADPGFDAVIGNPPYVRQERISAMKPFLQSQYQVYSGTADLFLYFFERGLEFLRHSHRLGYITSGTYMNSNSAKPLRQYLHAEASFDTLIDFGAVQPFRGVDMATNVMVVLLDKHKTNKPFTALQLEGRKAPDSLAEAVKQAGFEVLPDVTAADEWRFQAAQLTQLFKKISENQPALGDIIGKTIFRGTVTGFNEAFVIDQATRNALVRKDASSDDIIKPMLRGQDLRPWHQTQSGLFLIHAFQGINIDKYPAIKRHLAQYRAALEPKPKGHQGEWAGRAEGHYKWYELQTHSNDLFRQTSDGSKICWSDIARFPRFSFDKGNYFNNTVYFIPSQDFALLGLLQSRILWFAISQLATPLNIRLGLWRYRLFTQFIERLPIPTLTPDQETTLAELAQTITELAQDRYKLHEETRQTIVSEFDGEPLSSRVALYRWWELADDKALSDEIQKRFGQDIPLKKRGEWRGYLTEQKAEHDALTQKIIAKETALNEVVYDAFGLDAAERRLVEETTKYKYGEV